MQTVENLTLSENNYQSAWKTLTSRYENTRLITQHHIKAIFDLPSINKDYKSVLQLVHGLNANLNSLEAIKRPVKDTDDFVVYLISTKV